MKKEKLEYISKQLVERSSAIAFKIAARRAIKANGYVVVVKDGWIVKESSDGTTEQLKKIDPKYLNHDLILD